MLIADQQALRCVRWGCCLLLLQLSACKPSNHLWQTYEEINAAAPAASSVSMDGMRAAPGRSASSIAWTTPAGWKEEAGSGMRLATFQIEQDGGKATCTIITLGGAAGGLEANVRRWLGQLKIEAPVGAEWTAFLEAQQRIQSAGGWSGVVTDLSGLGPQTPETPSMLAGLFSVDESTLFIKLTGPLSVVKQLKTSFVEFCQSLRQAEKD